jgi:hypothetical protein
MKAAGPESNGVAAGWIEFPYSVTWLPQGNRRQEHVLPPSRRLLAGAVFAANVTLFLSPAAVAILIIAGVLR